MKVIFEKLKELDYHSNEAYKALRTNVTFCGDDVTVIAITSAVPNEGKSTVSFELARSFCDDGKKVLYIDADIRKSILCSRYGLVEEVNGLSHYLAGKNTLEEILYTCNVANLSLVFTGPTVPNPSELLGNARFEKLIAMGREKYDYVIIDCPPVGQVIDAAVIAKQCDGVALVIATENVSYRMLQKAKQQIEQSGCRMLGAILNKVEVNGKGYGKYYGRYYGTYEYYGQED